MEISYQNIVLRDMIASDIEDYVRWNTTDTKWSDYDAPWEPVSGDAEAERKRWTKSYLSGKERLADELRRGFEIEWNGKHIGSVNSYLIDEKYDWIPVREIKDGQRVHRAIGIDIYEPGLWGRGIGTNALRAFMQYYLKHGVDAIYTQTWSGNDRMIRCAEKVGFIECDRRFDACEVDGKKYDALTLVFEPHE
ncbi:MAG: GNAT family N-acetyltransferase [Clostridiales bacterium]|nr:GNAT family N-acetyltransferase [Clostridiales bacterium]